MYTPIIARVVRAAVLAAKAEVYVEGARALGAPVPWLVLRHILPNSTTPVLVQASVLMAIAILVEAALSFLGVGVKPPTPSLGLMLADGRGFMLQAPVGRRLPRAGDHGGRPRLQHAGRRASRLARSPGGDAMRRVVNLTAARALGPTIPQSVLLRATKSSAVTERSTTR